MTSRTLLAGAALALATLAAPARGALTEPTLAGRTLRPAERLAVSFPLPEDATEWEAYLSLDGGASFPLRLTRQRHDSHGTFLFDVPNLPSFRARLVVRCGRDGKEASERDVALSETFRILPGAAPGERAPVAGNGSVPRRADASAEWLAGEARADGASGAPSPAGIDAPGERLVSLPASCPFLLPAPAAGAPSPDGEGRPVAGTPPARPPRPRGAAVTRAPLFTPLLI